MGLRFVPMGIVRFFPTGRGLRFVPTGTVRSFPTGRGLRFMPTGTVRNHSGPAVGAATSFTRAAAG